MVLYVFENDDGRDTAMCDKQSFEFREWLELRKLNSSDDRFCSGTHLHSQVYINLLDDPSSFLAKSE